MLVDHLERFWAWVEKGEPLECWRWKGPRDGKGYGRLIGIGRLGCGAKSWQATHVALAVTGVRRPSEAHLALHACDNPICVNPHHLRWGTHAENADDRNRRGRTYRTKKRRKAEEVMDERAQRLGSIPRDF